MKKLVSLLFHRVVLVAFFLLIQVAVLVVMLLRFNNYFLPFYGVCVAISLFAVFWIVGRQSDPAYKIAWIIPILVFPIFGGLFYLLFGGNRLSLSVTLFESNGIVRLSAIASGGSQAMFWKVNTVGEESFLEKLDALL